MLYAIEAREQTYQGLHGIYDRVVVELDSIQEAEDYACELSEDVICSFGLEPEPDEDEEWTSADYDDAYLEQIDYSIWEIPDAKGLSIEDLQDMFYNDMDGFLDEYCKDC